MQTSRVDPGRCGASWSVRVASLALSLGLVLAPAGPALGADSYDVLIIGDGNPELLRKLRAEAAYAGFRPIELERAEGTAATLRVLSGERVELSVAGAGGEGRFEQTLVSRAGERQSFALRVVEQLRARLVDVGWTLPTDASPPPAPSPADTGTSGGADVTGVRGDGRPVVTRRDPGPSDDASATTGATGRVWLDAAVVSSWAKGGLGVTLHAGVGLQLDLDGVWHARATSLWPLHEAELEANEGEASVAWTGFTATLARSLPLPRPWLGQVGLGAGLLVIDGQGEGQGEFSGRRETLHVGTYFGELSFGRELASWLTLRASARGGLVDPRPVLRFDEREVASLGPLVGSLAIGLGLSWPHAPEPP
jgi:hypothetical protein